MMDKRTEGKLIRMDPGLESGEIMLDGTNTFVGLGDISKLDYFEWGFSHLKDMLFLFNPEHNNDDKWSGASSYVTYKQLERVWDDWVAHEKLGEFLDKV